VLQPHADDPRADDGAEPNGSGGLVAREAVALSDRHTDFLLVVVAILTMALVYSTLWLAPLSDSWLPQPLY
jgi:hypothetical protein